MTKETSGAPRSNPPALAQSVLDRYLPPSYSLVEVMFGLIMVLTATLGAGLVTGEGEGSEYTMLLAALGCNLAWGIIDGAMYIMDSMFDRGRAARILLEVKRSGESAALATIGRELDPRLRDITTPDERSRIYRTVLELAGRRPVRRTRLERRDVYGGLACLVLVFVTALPPSVPFLLFHDARLALRISNGILLAMLFFVGYFWARHTNANRVGFGLAMMLVGLVLVGAAMALGG